MRRQADSERRPDVSVVVVTFNSEATIGPCLEAVEGSDHVSTEVIVVDNDSSDSTTDVVRRSHPDAVVITPHANLGFARGCNLGASKATADTLLFLNPDTVVEPDAIVVALEALRSDPTIGAVGATTLYADGSVNRTCCFAQPTLTSTALRAVGVSSLLRNSTRFNPEEIGGWDRSTTRDVGVITGCFLMVDRDRYGRLGGFDEQFFMYSEDTDLSLRIQEQQWRCVHLADAIVLHHGGRSDHVPAQKMIKVLSARARFFRKHWAPWRARVGVSLLDLTVLLRVIATRVLRRESKWSDVWSARGEWRGA